ncbi:MAG: hypothetical protein JWQ09_906 [Segetibacter sp.]|nr:hypothetical protein [Segetibacter sp.]
MRPVIISDTSCLILLDKIGEIEILHHLFREIITTQVVVNEFGKALPDWIIILNPGSNINYTALQASLGPGEASAIALALDYDDPILLIDEVKGRKIAMRFGLHVTGTFGVIAQAKIEGIIPSVKPLLEKIKQTNFYISLQLVEALLKIAGE